MGDDGAKQALTVVRTIGVPVADQERALQFYTERLGFEKRVDVGGGSFPRWIEVAPRGATTTLALMPAAPGETLGTDTRIRFHTDDAAAAHADLRAQGVDVDAEVLEFPVKMFVFRDPDGNRLIAVEPPRT